MRRSIMEIVTSAILSISIILIVIGLIYFIQGIIEFISKIRG